LKREAGEKFSVDEGGAVGGAAGSTFVELRDDVVAIEVGLKREKKKRKAVSLKMALILYNNKQICV
jgi:hypothetical protein